MSPSEVDSTKDVEKKPSQRRINKPLIEKRRRARINDSLAQLKSIVLEASDSKGTRPSKLEKADILEMTVDFIKKQSAPTINTGLYCTENPIIHRPDEYSAGYSKCLSEISKFLQETRTVDDASQKLIDHISNKLKPDSEASSGPNSKIYQDKIRIEPLRQQSHKESPDKTNEAVDLSIRGTKAKEKDATETRLAQSVVSEGLLQPSTSCHVTNQQVPVGLVCGSHLMLLVQLPSSVTSQQLIKPNVISLNPHIQNTQGAMGFVPMASGNFSSANLSSGLVPSATSTTQNKPSDTVPTAVTKNVTLTSSEIKPEPNTLNPETIHQNRDLNSDLHADKNHWRPW